MTKVAEDGAGAPGLEGAGRTPVWSLGAVGPRGCKGQGGPPSGALGRGPQGWKGREDPHLEPWGGGPQGLEGQGGPREPCREHSLLPP